MKTVYDVPTEEMKAALASALVYHPKLVALEFAIAVQSVCKIDEDDGLLPALRCHGMAANAVIRKVPKSKRMWMDYDVMIDVDLARWNELGNPERIALFDHELTHVRLIEDKAGMPIKDEEERVKFKLIPDEITFTGFSDVIRRHGRHALEFRSIESVHDLAQSAIAVYDNAARVAASTIAAA